ncbi:MAG TPA: ABC transporter substrate-binding protein/permease [Myxococcota bacterium]|nr:ABC transporter substrate-binding protein/permease [Myxococcota bacterium]
MARANELEDAKKNGALVWGADQEGGGPYIFPREDDPEQVIGFEVDLAKALAKYLGVKDTFYQSQWDNLLDMLQAKKVQIVLNGYEWSPQRADAYEASIPYYVYALQLMSRTDDASIKSWDDLLKPRPDGGKYQIGVLVGSASEEVMKEHCKDKCDVIPYDGNTDAMLEVQNEKIDATLQDTPIAAFYGKEFPRLHNVEAPRAPGYYVIYARKGETEIINAVNEALIYMIRSGDLERIYKTYGIWDDLQSELVRFSDDAKFFGYVKAALAEVKENDAPTQAELQDFTTRKEGWDVVVTYMPTLTKAAGMTVVLSVLSFPLAILIGMLVAVGRLYGPGWVRAPLAAYVEMLRGTPLMLQLYFIFFVLPELGVNVPAFATAIFGLAINYSAYESEIYRAGIQAIPPGQMEAALSLGMSRAQAIRRIILPQAFRMVIPPVVNDFIALFKDTSVCSVITIIELTKQFSILAKSTLAIIEMMGMTAVLYLLMSYPMSLLARYVEKRLGSSGVV